jgi:hypothetical protein
MSSKKLQPIMQDAGGGLMMLPALNASRVSNLFDNDYAWLCPTCKSSCQPIEHGEIVTCGKCKTKWVLYGTALMKVSQNLAGLYK